MHAFRRAIRYIFPHWPLVVLAVLAAFALGALQAASISTLIPILKVMTDKEGLHGWWQLQLLGARSDSEFAVRWPQPDSTKGSRVRIHSVEEDGSAEEAGLRAGDHLLAIDGVEVGLPNLVDLLEKANQQRFVVLHVSRIGGDSAKQHDIELQLQPLKWHQRAGNRLVARAPRGVDSSARLRLLTYVMVLFLLINLLRNICYFTQFYLSHNIAALSLRDLRADAYDATIAQPLLVVQKRGIADTSNRFITDSHVLYNGYRTVFGQCLREPLKAAGAMGVAVVVAPRLTAMVFVLGLPLVLGLRFISRHMKRATKKSASSWGRLLKALEESLFGLRVLKVFTMERGEAQRFRKEQQTLLKYQVRVNLLRAVTRPLMEFVGFFAMAAGIVGAGYFLFRSEMKGEHFLVLGAALAFAFDSLRKLAGVANDFTRANASSERVFELIDAPKESKNPDGPAPTFEKGIEFRGVYFAYTEGSEVLTNLDLTVTAGETVAVVGPNGSGKSTLMSMLPRLISPTRGTILIDGVDLQIMNLVALRRQIAVVTQDAVLFNNTLAANIAYGQPEATEEQIVAAARAAYADEFISELPNGYQAQVAEQGASLSGGQKQRIALARAILRDPRLLILDEAMSQVDPDSEVKIQQALEQFVKGRSCLLIAHRFSTVLAADRIVVLDRGQIVGTGTHAQLTESCPLYRSLYETQLQPV